MNLTFGEVTVTCTENIKKSLKFRRLLKLGRMLIRYGRLAFLCQYVKMLRVNLQVWRTYFYFTHDRSFLTMSWHCIILYSFSVEHTCNGNTENDENGQGDYEGSSSCSNQRNKSGKAVNQLCLPQQKEYNNIPWCYKLWYRSFGLIHDTCMLIHPNDMAPFHF